MTDSNIIFYKCNMIITDKQFKLTKGAQQVNDTETTEYIDDIEKRQND